MRLRRVFIFVALAGLVLTCCSPAARPASIIRVGLVAELSGDLPAVGASSLQAAELAVSQINAEGGLQVGNRKYTVELVVEDNATSIEQTIQVTRKLIQDDKVIAIIGPNASRFAIPAARVAEEGRVVLISPWSTNPQTTLDETSGVPRQYVLRAAFVDAFQGQLVARFAMDFLHAQKTAVLYDIDSDYNRGIAEIFRQTIEAEGGQVVAFEGYSAGTTDFTDPLERIRDAGPELIFLPNYYTEVPLQIQQAHQLGILVPFLGSDAWGTPELISLCGPECEGFYFSTHYFPDPTNPAETKFIESYQKLYGAMPDDVAALTYDSFGLLFEGLQKSSTLDHENLRDALHEIDRYQGVTGNMLFRPDSGDPIKSAVILQIRGGQFVWFANINP